MERYCPCSNEDCYDKVPIEAKIPNLRNDSEPHIRVVQVTSNIVKPVKVLSWNEWKELCDNCRFTEDGRKWEPYVPKPR